MGVAYLTINGQRSGATKSATTGGCNLKCGAQTMNEAPSNTDRSLVLSRAVIRAADGLAIPRETLAEILGSNLPTIADLYEGRYQIRESRREWERCLLFLKMYESLYSITGGENIAHKWLYSQNIELEGLPIDLIKNTEGFRRVVKYLEEKSQGVS